MRELDKDIRFGGGVLKQVARDGNIAIYEQNGGMAWEVIEVIRASAGRIMGKDYPEREVYPGNEMWGRKGWTCMSLERAKEKMKQLLVGTI